MRRSNSALLVQRKVAVLGYRGVGKTNLTTRFVEDAFSERYDPTIENTYRKMIRFRRVHFSTDIVDTAGVDEFSKLSRNALVGVHGYLLVYSITSRLSFEKVKLCNGMLLNMMGDTPDVPRVLVGSMADLSEQRQVSVEEGQALADQWGAPFVECSSKRDINVTEVFITLMKEVERGNGLVDTQRPAQCHIA